MSSLTRRRADYKSGVPSSLHVEYYCQRADAGLILTEASPISPFSNSFPGACCIYSQEQVVGWSKVVDSVHLKGAKIYLQLFHCGRKVDPKYIENQTPIAPSPIKCREAENMVTPREMS